MSVAKIDNIGGGITLEDINPNKLNQHGSYTLLLPASSSNYYITFPVQGYSSIAFAKADSSITLKYYFDLNDGTSTSVTTLTVSQNIWSSDIDIPDNAMFIKVASSSGNASVQYAMKA